MSASEYKLDVVGVEVRWEGSGTESAAEYTFELSMGFLCMSKIFNSDSLERGSVYQEC
jgi:hypothetical protein